MSINQSVNAQAGGETGQVDSTTTENVSQQVQNATESLAASSAETVKPDNREQMIPRARFDQVNTELQRLKSMENDLKIVEEFNQVLESNPEIAEEIKSVFEKRKQRSQPAETPTQSRATPDPVVQSLAKEVFLIKAKESVSNYQAGFMNLAKADGISQEQMPLYQDAVERAVIQKLNGDLTKFDKNILADAYREQKQYLDQFLKPRAQNVVDPRTIPVTRPQAPIEAKRFRTQEDRTRFIAEGLKASRTS